MYWAKIRMKDEKRDSREMQGLILSLLAAPVLWYGIFMLDVGNFWLKISIAATMLALWSFRISPDAFGKNFRFRTRHLAIGIVSALCLYFVFLFGNIFLTVFFHSTKASIESVYAPKQGLPDWGIALLLLFVTSPAEEIFWRGFVQRLLMKKFRPVPGFFLALLCYAGVHIVTLNVPLVLAALVAGFFWGLIYAHQKSLWPAIISHAIWSVLVFLIFPFA